MWSLTLVWKSDTFSLKALGKKEPGIFLSIASIKIATQFPYSEQLRVCVSNSYNIYLFIHEAQNS